MKYVILIIVGIAGLMMGNYFGRRLASAKTTAKQGRKADKPLVVARGEIKEDVEKKRENLEKSTSDKFKDKILDVK